MYVKIASMVAFFVFTFLVIQPVQASVNLPYLDSFGMQGLVKSGVFTFPQYVAVDDSSNFYVTDLGNARVQKFDKNGEFLTSWGSKGMGNTEFHAQDMKKGASHDHHHGSGASIELEPGQSGDLVVRFAKATVLQMACLIPGHYEAGMKGQVQVLGSLSSVQGPSTSVPADDHSTHKH